MSAGIVVDASHKYHNQIPTYDGRHMWVVITMYRILEPAASPDRHLDLENLLTIEGPGCYFCEERWSPKLGAHCPGPPGCGPACADHHTFEAGCVLEGTK